MSDTTREVEELQHDEHIHAAASIGGVLNGIFITPYTTIMEHKIPQIKAASHFVSIGLSLFFIKLGINGRSGNFRPGIIVRNIAIYSTSTKIIRQIIFSPVKSWCPRQFRLFK